MSTQTPDSVNPRYHLVTKLGQGGMARVLLMLSRSHSRAQKLVVVKELLPTLANDADLRTMFLDEGRLAVRLNHPNVVQTYEVTSEGKRPLIVMEYLDGQSLAAVLNRVGRAEVPVELHLFILTQVLIGLHHAHELCDFDGTPLNVVHRDVSPQNVFVTYDGHVKLVDFGIAKAAGSDSHTATGVFKGKISYAAPEQIERGALDRRCDVFAVGVMLWEALAQRRIGVSAADAGGITRRLHGEEPRLAEVAPETPPALVRICEKAMALDPDARFATAEAFRAALDEYLESSKRAGVHELAAFMRATFAAERTSIRQLIDARIKEIGAARPAAPAPDPDPDPDPESPEPGAAASASEATVPTGGTGARTSLVSDHDISGTAPRAGRARGRVLIGVALVAASALVGASLLRRSAHGTAAAVTAAASSTAAAPPPDTAAVAATVAVGITAEPAAARIFLDDVETSANPFRGALPRSAVARRVRAAAPGFVTEERLVVFDRDVQLQLQLRPAPSGSAAEPRPAPPSTRPAAPPAPVLPRAAPVAATPPVTTGAPPPPTAAPPRMGDAMPSASAKRSRPIDDAY